MTGYSREVSELGEYGPDDAQNENEQPDAESAGDDAQDAPEAPSSADESESTP